MTELQLLSDIRDLLTYGTCSILLALGFLAGK